MITSAESVIVGSAITAAGWSVAARWQHRGARTSERIEQSIIDLGDRLTTHTAEDAKNFEELRGLIPARKRFRLLPAFISLLRLFL